MVSTTRVAVACTGGQWTQASTSFTSTRITPHYLTGEHKGFWSWTFREAGVNLVKEGAITEDRYEELAEGMRVADEDSLTVVAHARMHRLVARKP